MDSRVLNRSSQTSRTFMLFELCTMYHLGSRVHQSDLSSPGFCNTFVQLYISHLKVVLFLDHLIKAR